jgi:osmotically-inducible protein OsmY
MTGSVLIRHPDHRAGRNAATTTLCRVILGTACLAAPVNAAVTDRWISGAVQDELAPDRGVSPNVLDVDTTDGVVTLSASVDNILAKERALQIAKSIRGVRAVIDLIDVTPSPRRDDHLRNDILLALKQDPATGTCKVDVAVETAVVTLTGRVGSWTELRLAARIAKHVRGVKQLDNQLRIDLGDDRSDSEMAEDIASRLEWDIWVNNGVIAAQVMKGRVKLKGVVGTARERSRAADDAWVNGVTSVDDSALEVDSRMRNEVKRRRVFAAKTDDDVKRAVEAAFRHDPRLSGCSPDVSVEDGIITLGGIVDSLKEKAAAEQDARNTVGASWVRDHLEVRPNPPPTDEARDGNEASAGLGSRPR